jgi:uncharacterized ion transporter superfamily protein YfcC
MTKLKKMKLPHTLMLIYIMVVLTVITAWIVPGAGPFQLAEYINPVLPTSGVTIRF